MQLLEKHPTLTLFANTWEQRKLGEEVDFFTGLTYSPSDVVADTGTLVLRSSNVQGSEIVLNDNVFVDSSVVNSEPVRAGDIVVVVRNGSRALIGKHAVIRQDMPNTVIGAFMTGIRSKHSSFTNALLNTSAFDSEIKINLGATINQITGGMFSKMSFMFPESRERHQIGTFFQQLDTLITLHQRELFSTEGGRLCFKLRVMSCSANTINSGFLHTRMGQSEKLPWINIF